MMKKRAFDQRKTKDVLHQLLQRTSNEHYKNAFVLSEAKDFRISTGFLPRCTQKKTPQYQDVLSGGTEYSFKGNDVTMCKQFFKVNNVSV